MREEEEGDKTTARMEKRGTKGEKREEGKRSYSFRYFL